MTNSIWSTLLAKDQALFSLINTHWTHPLLDKVLPWCRNANNWYPFYAVLLVYLFIKWGSATWKWLLFAVINLTLTDQISSSIFKPLVHRLRPCADPMILGKTRLLLDHCSGGFSFTSSHAANHFGLAMFMFMSLQPLFKKYTWLFFIWAATIAYAQVYVGVHYPLDVFAGAIIGIIVGAINGMVYKKYQHAKK
jgi:membrane-associated phospholipid phosphatase